MQFLLKKITSFISYTCSKQPRIIHSKYKKLFLIKIQAGIMGSNLLTQKTTLINALQSFVASILNFKVMNFQVKTKVQKPVVIQCYASPFTGHMTPILKIIEMIQQKHPEYQIKFLTSEFVIQNVRASFPAINMEGIKDEMSPQFFTKNVKFGLFNNPGLAPLFRLHEQYFKQKTNKPDLIICDFFEESAMEFAKKHKIKYIINSAINCESLKDCYSFPTFNQSISFAGLAILYPKLFNDYEEKGFCKISNAFRYSGRILINSAFGLQNAVTIPPNHSLIGLLSNCNKNKGEIGEQLAAWMKQWKSKGKNKFIYISFGTVIIIAEQFAVRFVKILEELGYPVIWSFRAAYADKINSKLIFHRPWLAQEAVLALPQVKCYVCHCGWGSVTEAVASETPLICVPSFGDQPFNAQLVHAKKIGIQIFNPTQLDPTAVFLPKISDETIRSAFTKVMNDESFQQNIKKVNALCKTYKTEAIVNNIVEETLEYGYEHLIDQNFDKYAGKSIKLPFNLLVILLVAAAVYLGAKYLGILTF